MTDDFQSLSNKIANDFIQSVVFIDDKAYSAKDPDDWNHEFDAQAITKAFAHDHKICAVYQPNSEADIDVLSIIAEKADVAVIDWTIILSEPHIQPDSLGNATDAEDDDEDEVKGIYTKKMINRLLKSKSNQNSLKLIIIYTGESNLTEIATEIQQAIELNGIENFVIDETDPCCVFSNSCKILVVTKSNGGLGRQTHNPELKNKEVAYEDLPKFITTEFSKMTEGILPIFALKSLSAIRQNYYQILNIFSKELDTAYLTNQSLLPNTEDANELLVELLGDTFSSILRANNLNNLINEDFIGSWLDSNIEDKNKPKYDKEGEKIDGEYSLTKGMLQDILKPHSNVEKKFKDVLNVAGISKKSTTRENYTKYAFDLFHEEDEKESVNIGFAKLCQHKNLVHHESYLPSLSLGTIVKSSLRCDNYLVCIQQRCDSVRVKLSEGRRFLFLPLSIVKSNEEFDFITPDEKKLKLDRKSFHLRTVKFNGSNNGMVQSNSEDTQFFFKPVHHSDESHERFEFIFELKDLYAQRIVADYSASLARVGLDEPEWVRLMRPS